MVMTYIPEPDSDASGLGIGFGDCPISLRPWRGFVFGAKHVAETDYDSLRDFCGAERLSTVPGLLSTTGAPPVRDYDHQVGPADFYTTPFTVGEHLANGSGTIISVGMMPDGNVAMIGGLQNGEGGKGGLQIAFLQDNYQLQVQATDITGATRAWTLPVPKPAGGTPYGQILMAAGVLTPTTIMGYSQNSAGIGSGAAVAKPAGAYAPSDRRYKIGASYVGQYTGIEALTLVLFYQAALTTAQLAQIYADIKAWLNEHAMGA